MSVRPPVPTGRPRATIRDVAALAGVGIKTVSRVINNEANVSPQMQERVQRAIRTLNFKPNQGAGALRRGDRKTLTLGLLIDAVDNPFSASLNRAVETVAATRHTAVFAASFDDDADRERELVDAFTRRRVDGLILTTITAEHGYLQSEREQGMPIVFVDRPPVGLAVDAVLSNNYEAAYQATRHLIEHGHRRIAHLGDELAISTARERRRGFTDAMAGAGLTDQVAQRHLDNIRSEQDAYDAVQRVLRLTQPADGVVHLAEHDHHRRHPRTAPPRPPARRGTDRLRRPGPRRRSPPRRDGDGPGSDPDGHHRGRAPVRPVGRGPDPRRRPPWSRPG